MKPPSSVNETVKIRIKRKLLFFKQAITVEPLLACYIFTVSLCRPVIDNLELEKSCRVNLQYNSSICDGILNGQHTNLSMENQLVQVEISNVRSWQQPLQSLMPLVLVLFLGSFSDRYKCRKPFILLPIIGEIIGLIGCLVCVIFMSELPLEVFGISQKIIPSFFGGRTMLVMASISYIADVSTLEMRTFRVGVIQIVLSVFSLLVQPFSGLLLWKLGYVKIVLTGIVLLLLAFCYGLLWIKEPVESDITINKNCNQFTDIFNPADAMATFKLLFRKKSHNIHIGFLLMTMFLYKCAYEGESNLLFLYTQNKFTWTPVEFGYFLAVNSLTHLIGTTVGIIILTKILKLNDLSILLLTITDRIVTNLVYGTSQTVAVFYLGVIISLLTGLTKVTVRSLATKIVSKDDLGKAQSLFGISEALIPTLTGPIYNKLIYVKTIEYFPSAFYFFSIILYSICWFIVLYMFVEERRSQKTNLNIKEAG